VIECSVPPGGPPLDSVRVDASANPDRPATAFSVPRRVATLVAKSVLSVGLLVWLLSGVDLARLWASLRAASWGWLLAALALYFTMLLVSAWRWGVLLRAQGIRASVRHLLSSFLVATFFNNFLPSNIGGDVVRIRDTAGHTGSRTLATTVVLVDRALGLLALVLTAALGATIAGRLLQPQATLLSPWLLWAGFGVGAGLWAQAVRSPWSVLRLAKPLRRLHAEWVDARIERMVNGLERFRDRPAALAASAGGALFVQLTIVAFYAAIARSMDVPISPWHLAVIVPVSLVVQMLPISMNGFGVREATFVTYFALLGLPAEPALLMSFVGAALVMCWSLAGAVVHVTRHG
jgi:uncharacterized protein (TIRG00374 family)